MSSELDLDRVGAGMRQRPCPACPRAPEAPQFRDCFITIPLTVHLLRRLQIMLIHYFSLRPLPFSATPMHQTKSGERHRLRWSTTRSTPRTRENQALSCGERGTQHILVVCPRTHRLTGCTCTMPAPSVLRGPPSSSTCHIPAPSVLRGPPPPSDDPRLSALSVPPASPAIRGRYDEARATLLGVAPPTSALLRG